MLGCYVGPTGIAAQGVPARFLNADAEDHGGPGRTEPANGMMGTATTAAGGTTTPMAGGEGDAMEVG